MPRITGAIWMMVFFFSSFAHGEEKSQARRPTQPRQQSVSPSDCPNPRCYVVFTKNQPAIQERVCGPFSSTSETLLAWDQEKRPGPNAHVEKIAADHPKPPPPPPKPPPQQQPPETPPEPPPRPQPPPQPRRPCPWRWCQSEGDPAIMPLPDNVEVKSDATLILFEREGQQGAHCTFPGPRKLPLKNSCPKTIGSIQITCDASTREDDPRKESPTRTLGPKSEPGLE